MSKKYIIAFFIISLLAGCQKPGPIQLIDNDTPPQAIQIDTTSGTSQVTTQNPDDTLGVFSPMGINALGHITIAGMRFDTPREHYDGTMAEAVFFTRNQRIVVRRPNGGFDTLCRSVDAGIVRVNSNPVFAQLLRDRDTIIGPIYSILNMSGNAYIPRASFRWQSTGSVNVPAFDFTILTTPKFHIDSPTPMDVINPTRNLRVRWSGDSVRLTVLIRPPFDAEHLRASDLNAKPLLKFNMTQRAKELVIPSNVLGLLQNQRSYIFTFVIESNRIEHINGYPEDVLLSASYRHHLLLKIRR